MPNRRSLNRKRRLEEHEGKEEHKEEKKEGGSEKKEGGVGKEKTMERSRNKEEGVGKEKTMERRTKIRSRKRKATDDHTGAERYRTKNRRRRGSKKLSSEQEG